MFGNDYINGAIIQSGVAAIDIDKFDPCDNTMNSKLNLISTNIFDTLPNCKSICIKTNFTNLKDTNYAFPFNMFEFLDIISRSSIWNKIEIIYTSRPKIEQATSWISKTWKMLSGPLREAYNRNGVSIKFMAEEDTFWGHRFVISRDRSMIAKETKISSSDPLPQSIGKSRFCIDNY